MDFTNLSSEQKTAILSEYDIILVADGSGSMSAKLPNGKTRWAGMQEQLCQITREVEQIDSDGLGLILFNRGNIIVEDGMTADKIETFFSKVNPGGSTPMAEALDKAFSLAGKSAKKDMVVVFTDGEPDNKTAVMESIKRQASKQEKDEDCTVLFIQVGDDADATKFLSEIDDNLKGAKFDIVDVKTYKEAERFASAADLLCEAITG